MWLSVDVYLSLPLIFSKDCEEEEDEAFDVSLTKNTQGLGITIAGYVADKNSGEKWQLLFQYVILSCKDLYFFSLKNNGSNG